MANRNRRAFTLVEILIVVIILGILAAIVIPQFANASADARKATLLRQLHTIRSQIQMYIVDYEGAVPDLTGGWAAMTQPATHNGKTCGPYLQSPPRNSVNRFTGVAIVTSDANFGDAVTAAEVGFVYNSNNGLIWATNKTGNRVYNEADLNDSNN